VLEGRGVNHRSKALTESARGETCVACGICDETIVWAHSNEQIHGKGAACKAHDLLGNYLCYRCHMGFDSLRNDREKCRQQFREWYPKTMVRVAEKIATGKLKL
jgi:hypothetical protein